MDNDYMNFQLADPWTKYTTTLRTIEEADFPRMRPYPGSLAASTSTFSITGGCASSSDAFAIIAAATWPERWA